MPADRRKRKHPEGEERNRLRVYLRQIPRCCSDTRSSVSNENSSKSQTTTSRSGSSSSSYKSSPYDSYDKGYDDIYMDGDYDWDRYNSDPDYADGVDDAMDEFDEEW